MVAPEKLKLFDISNVNETRKMTRVSIEAVSIYNAIAREYNKLKDNSIRLKYIAAINATIGMEVFER